MFLFKLFYACAILQVAGVNIKKKCLGFLIHVLAHLIIIVSVEQIRV